VQIRTALQFYFRAAGKIEECGGGRCNELWTINGSRAIRNQLIIGIIKLSAFTCSPRAINAER